MAIYFGTFFLSTFFLFIAEKTRSPYRKIIIAIGLLIPIMLAGMRKIGIGTDTEVYVNVLYEAAHSSSGFFDYLGQEVYSSFQMKPVTNWEIGYNLLVYISTKITNSYQGVLFATHLLTIGFVYKGLVKLDANFSKAFAMLIFYFMFYASSLNLMRQWIAVAIIFYGFHYIQDGKTKKYLFCVVLAVLFHNSAILGIVIWLIYYFFVKFNSERELAIGGKRLDSNLNNLIIFTIVCVAFLFSISVVANILGSINAVFARYARLYISGNIQLMPMQIIRRLPIILLLIINWKKLNSIEKNTPFYYAMVVLDVAISQMGSLTSQSTRMGYFFSVFEIIILAELICRRRRDWKVLYGVVLIMYCAILFYYDNGLMGRSEVVPYLFYFN